MIKSYSKMSQEEVDALIREKVLLDEYIYFQSSTLPFFLNEEGINKLG